MKLLKIAVSIFAGLVSALALAHGDVTPQVVDTSKLPQLGKEWKDSNPYRGNADAIAVGSSGYNQNCARCHGLEAISGGIAPDLRKLSDDCASLRDAKKKDACMVEIENYYVQTVRRGRTRNGAVYMPPFEDILTQEAVWAIKAYVDTRKIEEEKKPVPAPAPAKSTPAKAATKKS